MIAVIAAPAPMRLPVSWAKKCSFAVFCGGLRNAVPMRAPFPGDGRRQRLFARTAMHEPLRGAFFDTLNLPAADPRCECRRHSVGKTLPTHLRRLMIVVIA